MNKFFTMLKKDHKEVKKILTELNKTRNGSKNRKELFEKLQKELVPHMKSEEKTFYKSLLDKKESREDALEGVEEHHVTEMVLKELKKVSKDDDQWGAKISVFKELVEHHIKEEESTLFKVAEEALSEDKIKTIMKEFEQEKQKLKKKMK